jgi:hypothetical protein
MHYYKVRSPERLRRRLEAGERTLGADDLGERMYTMTLRYDAGDDCYRGDQRYPVKLHHLVGMMPEDAFKKMFSRGAPDAQAPARPPMPMPGAEWHVLELYPTHAMYMHAFLADLNDAAPMPMMGMQKPYRFLYAGAAS